MNFALFLTGLASMLITLCGFILAYAYRKQPEHFRWSEYFALIIVPLTLIAYAALSYDIRILLLFIIGAVSGTVYEFVIGFTYHKVMGARLWTYHRFSFSGYTSVLSLVLWGFGAVLFWMLGKALGL